jgi:hypothetical protein
VKHEMGACDGLISSEDAEPAAIPNLAWQIDAALVTVAESSGDTTASLCSGRRFGQSSKSLTASRPADSFNPRGEYLLRGLRQSATAGAAVASGVSWAASASTCTWR